MSFYIIFGHTLTKTGKISRELKTRLDLFLKKDNLISKIIVSGGNVAKVAHTEAFQMKQYLVLNGVHKDRIISESKSNNTFENIKFSLDLIFNSREKNIKKQKINKKNVDNKTNFKRKITLKMVSSKKHYNKIKSLARSYINKSNLKNKIIINYL